MKTLHFLLLGLIILTACAPSMDPYLQKCASIHNGDYADTHICAANDFIEENENKKFMDKSKIMYYVTQDKSLAEKVKTGEITKTDAELALRKTAMQMNAQTNCIYGYGFMSCGQ